MVVALEPVAGFLLALYSPRQGYFVEKSGGGLFLCLFKLVYKQIRFDFYPPPPTLVFSSAKNVEENQIQPRRLGVLLRVREFEARNLIHSICEHARRHYKDVPGNASLLLEKRRLHIKK